MDSILKVANQYGWAATLALLVIGVVGWIFRLWIQNPLAIVSGALSDVEVARKALREEYDARGNRIDELNSEIETLKAKVAELESEIDDLSENGH